MARNRLNLWTVTQRPHGLLQKLGIRMVAGGHLLQKALLDPHAPYPYHHRGFAAARGATADPYPVSPLFRGDVNHDGRLSYFEAHPEWYAEIAGRRRDSLGTDTGFNFCSSNADAVRELTRNLVAQLATGAWRDTDVLAFWMLDNAPWCDCAVCRPLGPPTDRLMRLLGQVAGALRQAQVQHRLAHVPQLSSLAFQETATPPARAVPPTLARGLTMTYFPIRRCYAHALGDPACTEINAHERQAFLAWTDDPQRRFGGAIEIGEYYNLAEFHSLPLVFAHVIAADIPWYYAHGVRSLHYMHVVTRNGGPWALDHALLARLLWNPAQSPAAIVSDYLARRFPVTSGTMRRVYGDFETALANVQILMHEVTLGRAVFRMRRQLALGGSPFALAHFHRETFHPPQNDAPDLDEMLAAVRDARQALAEARRRCPPGAERTRLDEDAARFAYGDAMVEFFGHYLPLVEADHRGDRAAAAREWPPLAAAAARLHGMTAVTHGSSSHADCANGLVATGCAAELENLRARYGRATTR
jgi:uncharacterized protein DUF4838